jgi:hypothetical protein
VEVVIRDVTDQTGFCVLSSPTGGLVGRTPPTVGVTVIPVAVVSLVAELVIEAGNRVRGYPYKFYQRHPAGVRAVRSK